MCENDPRCPGNDDKALARILDSIERYGWALIGVFGSTTSLPSTYTVGLTAIGYPELALYGLPMELSGAWLNAIADHVVRTGPLLHGARLVTVDPDSPGLVAIRMTRPGELGMAEELYPTDPVLSMQIVWRDLDGLLPWQDGYDHERCPQPLYGPPPGLLSGPVVLHGHQPRSARRTGNYGSRYRRRRAG